MKRSNVVFLDPQNPLLGGEPETPSEQVDFCFVDSSLGPGVPSRRGLKGPDPVTIGFLGLIKDLRSAFDPLRKTSEIESLARRCHKICELFWCLSEWQSQSPTALGF